jgi:hypothetical protein
VAAFCRQQASPFIEVMTRRKRPKPSFGEDWSPEQLEHFMREAKRGADQLVNWLRMINISAVATPTEAQARAVRTFEPFRTQNLLSIRKALTEGPIRVGPLSEENAADAVARVLAPAGLDCRLVPLAPDDVPR